MHARTTALLVAILLMGTSAFAANRTTPSDNAESKALTRIDQRFDSAQVEETPDFQRHIVPLMGKVGCNGRACHGSFQGQGGFRLSLFGYDFKMDHEGLSDRIDLDDPKESYVLQKPTMELDHDGGEVLKKGSWQYNTFVNWIEGGAEGAETRQKLVKLDVQPVEILFSSEADRSQLKVTAVWDDGSREDVTPLCRFQTNDPTIAGISESGQVTAGTPGDTHVVVFYDAGVVPIPVMRPVSDQFGKSYPQIATKTNIDAHVINKLSKLGIVPSETCTDAEFLRRVTLDITGTLPTPSEIEAFVGETSAEKRSRKIDELLERPAYSAWWTTKLCDWTGNNDDNLNNVSPMRNKVSQEWYDWIYKRVDENVPYDELVEGIVVAKSREEGQSYLDYSEEMSSYYHDEKEPDAEGYQDRDSLTYYWARRNFRTNEERAIGFAYTFLGIRIQCAQCHKHPFDQWTQSDFEEFQGFFSRANYNNNGSRDPEYKELIASLGIEDLKGNDLRRELAKRIQKGETIPFPELAVIPPRKAPAGNNAKRRNRGGNVADTARILGGEEYDLNEYQDPRTVLMDWLRSDDNRLFARAFVNRVWSNYFNVGIVTPTDDLSLANPPSNAALLDYLADGFIASGYDMKWLHREIANSETYQRSWKTNATNARDETNFSHAVARRLPAEVALDAVKFATASTEELSDYHSKLEGRTIAIPGSSQRRNRGTQSYALTIFGRSTRDNNCDCDRSFEPSLLQTIYLQNDQEVSDSLDRRNGWLDQTARELKLDFKNSAPAAQPNAAVRKAYFTALQKLRKRLVAAQKAKEEAQVKAIRKKISQLQERYKSRGGEVAKTETNSDDEEAGGSGEKLSHEESQRLINEAFLRTLSRHPDADEMKAAQEYLTSAEKPLDGLRDVMWALLNTKEFLINH